MRCCVCPAFSNADGKDMNPHASTEVVNANGAVAFILPDFMPDMYPPSKSHGPGVASCNCSVAGPSTPKPAAANGSVLEAPPKGLPAAPPPPPTLPAGANGSVLPAEDPVEPNGFAEFAEPVAGTDVAGVAGANGVLPPVAGGVALGVVEATTDEAGANGSVGEAAVDDVPEEPNGFALLLVVGVGVVLVGGGVGTAGTVVGGTDPPAAAAKGSVAPVDPPVLAGVPAKGLPV